MFERSKANLDKLQTQLESALSSVQARTAGVRREIEHIDDGIFQAVDRVQAQIQKANQAARAELSALRAKIHELKPPER